MDYVINKCAWVGTRASRGVVPGEQGRAKPHGSGTGKGAGSLWSLLCCAEGAVAQDNLCEVAEKRHVSLNVLKYIWHKHLSL